MPLRVYCSLSPDLKRSTSQRESKLLDTIDQTNAMIDDQMADLKKRCASLEHELAISKETNCELQLCVRGKVSSCV